MSRNVETVDRIIKEKKYENHQAVAINIRIYECTWFTVNIHCNVSSIARNINVKLNVTIVLQMENGEWKMKREMRKGTRWTKIFIYYSYLFGAHEIFTSRNQFIFSLHYCASIYSAIFPPQTLTEVLIRTLCEVFLEIL